MKNVFLTGGAGFIGTHLIPILLDQGIGVTVFDDFSTGSYQAIANYVGKKGFRFYQGDLCHYNGVLKAMSPLEWDHDVVWHLGANTLIPAGSSDLNIDLQSNVIGTKNVLDCMRALGIKKILFASTAATYGDEPGVVLSEEHGPMKPISLYGASKLAAEAFLSAYVALFGLEAWVFRFSNVIGGGMGHGVIYDLVQKLRKTPKRLDVWGDGKGMKPYFLVEDCIRGMMTAYRNKPDLYNLGCSNATAVSKVAEIVVEEMGAKEVEIVYAGGRCGFPGDVPCVFYDTTKIEGIGWKTSMTSDEAVRNAAKRIISGNS